MSTIKIGTKVQRTSYTGLVMKNTVTKLKRIGTVMYAILDDGALLPVQALTVTLV